MLCLLSLGLAACGGGGGPSTSISVSPQSLHFSSELGETPAAQIVDAQYAGDGVVVGYPTGTTAASWLAVNTVSSQPGHAQFSVSASGNGYSSAQTLSTTLRFITGHVDNSGNVSDVVYTDVPVSFSLSPSTLTIGVTPQQLNFSVPSGASSAPQTLTIATSGDQAALLSSTAPYVQVSPGGQSGTGNLPFQVSVSAASLQPGQYSASLTFAASRAGDNYQPQVSVPVQLTVVPQLQASPGDLNYSAVQGSRQVTASQSVQIQGDGLNWTATADQGWAHLDTAAGAGAATIKVSVDPSGLPAGAAQAHITVRDSQYGQTQLVNIHLTVSPNQLVANPAAPAFALDATSTDAGLSRTITVTDQLGGSGTPLNWSLDTTGAPWLALSPASGQSAPPAQVTLSLNKSELAKLANGGSYSAIVSFRYADSSGASQSLRIPVGLALSLPRAEVISPAVIGAGHSLKVLVAGSGLQGVALSQISIGGQPVQALEPVSGGALLRATLPAFGAGSKTVSIGNVTGQNLSTAALTVVPATSYTYQAIAVQDQARRLLFDDAHQILYAVNNNIGQISRYQFSGGSWRTLSPWTLADVADAAFSPDHRSLYAVAEQTIYSVALDDPQATPHAVHTGLGGSQDPGNYDPSHREYLWSMGTGIGGNLALSTKAHGLSGTFDLYVYQIAANALQALSYPNGSDGANALTSGDGSLGLVSDPRDRTYQYDGFSGVLTQQADPFHPAVGLGAADAAGDHFIYNFREVHDPSHNLLGYTSDNPVVSAISQDGRRAYIYRASVSDTALGQNVHIIDLSAAPLSGSVFPELASVPIADSPISPSNPSYPYFAPTSCECGLAATVSADGRTYFLAGPDEVIVVPLPAN